MDIRKLGWPTAMVLAIATAVTGAVILAGPSLGLAEEVQTGAAALLGSLIALFVRSPLEASK